MTFRPSDVQIAQMLKGGYINKMAQKKSSALSTRHSAEKAALDAQYAVNTAKLTEKHAKERAAGARIAPNNLKGK